MAYPLDVGGVEDYPVKVGSMLLTMVDPHQGFEAAYNRWYERDHFYAGCMIGPYQLAGSRWAATRELKDLRWPTGETTIADPTDAGSYVAIYWVERDHHKDWDDWAIKQVQWLYGNGRGFAERSHVHTVCFDHVGAVYRDPDPVPIDLALDHCYDGIVAAWFDARRGSGEELHDALAAGPLPDLLTGSSIEIASSWVPRPEFRVQRSNAPMSLGTPGGGDERLCQLFFVSGDVRAQLDRFRDYTAQVGAQGLADTRLVAPFLRTVVGTDTYVDKLW